MTRPPSRRYLSNMDDMGGEEYDLNGAYARILMEVDDLGEWEHINENGDNRINWVYNQ